MKPKPNPRDAYGLFQAHFDQMLNPSHKLVLLANRINWSGLRAEFVESYCPDFGAPAKAIRLMVGLHYLKYAFDESDESVLTRWVENPYWQYFCGCTHMQHECPIHPTSLPSGGIGLVPSGRAKGSPAASRNRFPLALTA